MADHIKKDDIVKDTGTLEVTTTDLKELEEQVVAELGGALPVGSKADEFRQKISELEDVYKRLEVKIRTKKTEVKAGLDRLKALKAELSKEIDEIKNLEVLDQKIKDELKHLAELEEEVSKTGV